jgi:hypothetical protein
VLNLNTEEKRENNGSAKETPGKRSLKRYLLKKMQV